jgi:hypothetical protein
MTIALSSSSVIAGFRYHHRDNRPAAFCYTDRFRIQAVYL